MGIFALEKRFGPERHEILQGCFLSQVPTAKGYQISVHQRGERPTLTTHSPRPLARSLATTHTQKVEKSTFGMSLSNVL